MEIKNFVGNSDAAYHYFNEWSMQFPKDAALFIANVSTETELQNYCKCIKGDGLIAAAWVDPKGLEKLELTFLKSSTRLDSTSCLFIMYSGSDILFDSHRL